MPLEIVVGPHDDLLERAATALHYAGCHCPESRLGLFIADAARVVAKHDPRCPLLRDVERVRYVKLPAASTGVVKHLNTSAPQPWEQATPRPASRRRPSNRKR